MTSKKSRYLAAFILCVLEILSEPCGNTLVNIQTPNNRHVLTLILTTQNEERRSEQGRG